MLEAIKFVVKEHVDNRKMIMHLAIENVNQQTIRTSFGVFWLYFRDIMYFVVYTLFRVLTSGGGEIMGINPIVYLLVGLIPFFFMNEVLNRGTAAIKNNKSIIQSIKFPITTIPAIDVLTIFFQRIFTFVVLVVIVYAFGYGKMINYFKVIYFMIAMLVCMFILNLIISAFVAVSTDFHQLYMSLMRILIFICPVIWAFDKIESPILNVILHLNPLAYVISGFRNAFVWGGMPSMIYTIYFWLCMIVLLLLGCRIQYKLRKFYADFI
ncbi:MAG: ABC transporter permease [Clostridiales bacterium]|nr:ABC transporter permease [Clostridiales bacterium]